MKNTKLLDLISYYKYSLVVYWSLVLLLIAYYGLTFFNRLYLFLLKINWTFLIIGGIFIWLSYASFAFPEAIVNHKNFKEAIKKKITKYYESLIAKKDIKKNKFLYPDLFASLFLVVFLSLFVDFKIRLFFLSFALIQLIFLITKFRKPKPYLLMSFIPVYFAELFHVYFFFLAIGINLSLILLLCLAVSPRFLFYLPKFKHAGGLLEIYFMLFFWVAGYNILYGLFLSGLFRLGSILFFILPIYFLKK